MEIRDGETWTFVDPSWESNLPGGIFWFGRTIGAHLEYGEASAAEAGVSMAPSVTVRKGWAPRWIASALLYAALVLLAGLIERRFPPDKTRSRL